MMENEGEQMTESCDTGEDGFAEDMGRSNADLNNFFKRPVMIQNYAWSTNADLNTEFYPWKDFFSNKRVANRINNYKLMRAKLHVKFVINGNSFYYGRLLASYTPLMQLMHFHNDTDYTALTQRPHIMLDPATSQGGVLQLPFVWMEDYIDLPSTDLEELGAITMLTLAPLLKATDPSGVQTVNISVFAWAEDVVLGGLTVTDMAYLVPQSSSEHGLKLSNIASTISQLAGTAKRIPGIYPYAKATEIGAGAVASVARALGFSRPTNLEEPMRIQPRPATSLANVTGSDGCYKLTLDPKQEVSVDPRIWGCDGSDCMNFADVASVESMYAKFAISSTAGPSDLLWNTIVDPCVANVDPAYSVGSSKVRATFPACGGVALPFEYWTGSLEYTFTIVASAYHRGRIAVVYDPHQTPEAYESNIAYQHIIDISENREFKVRVGMAQSRALRRHWIPEYFNTASVGNIRGGHGTARLSHLSSKLNLMGNGTLSVYLINGLVGLQDTPSEIQVLVSIKACDDFKVFAPTSSNFNFMQYTSNYEPASSGVEPVSTDIVQPDLAITDIRGDMSRVSDIYCGEEIGSFRALMKRYCTYTTVLARPTSNFNPEGTNRMTHGIYPGNPLYANNCMHGASGVPINFIPMNYIAYVRAAYVILRGGTRWKFASVGSWDAVGDYACASTELATVTRSTDAETYRPFADTGFPTDINASPTDMARSGYFEASRGMEGGAITTANVNGVLEWEMPFYSTRRFVVGPSDNDAVDAEYCDSFRLEVGSPGLGQQARLYVAGAEDLTCGFFIGFPQMTFFASLPAA